MPGMDIIKALDQIGPVAACLIGGSIAVVVTAFCLLGAHLANRVSFVNIDREKGVTIRMRPPAKK